MSSSSPIVRNGFTANADELVTKELDATEETRSWTSSSSSTNSQNAASNDECNEEVRAGEVLTSPSPSSPSAAVVASVIDVEHRIEGGWKTLPASSKSLRTTNPIRAIVDPIVASMQEKKNNDVDDKPHISLALGDPTAAGNFPPCPHAVHAIKRTLLDPSFNKYAAGYVNACGTTEARTAIANFHSNNNNERRLPVSADNVVVANGCSGALEIALTALLDGGDGDADDSILLVPQPGFPLYRVIAESHGSKVVPYKLRSDQNWQIDLPYLKRLLQRHGTIGRPSESVDPDATASDDDDDDDASSITAGGRASIRGIIINNPGNPTGSVYGYQHLTDIVSLCHDYRLPIVADEIYGTITFRDNVFHPLAEVSHKLGRHVPVIAVSGIGKQYLLPGWRLGWIVFHDNIYGSLRHVEAGAKRLAQVVLGASHLVQTVVPVLLNHDEEEVVDDGHGAAVTIRKWKEELRLSLQDQAMFICEQITGTVSSDQLEVVTPGGAMYAMVRVHPDAFDENIANDVDFTKLLLKEENVFVLPGQCFGCDEPAFRVVFCAPMPVLRDAAERIATFCARHSSGTPPPPPSSPF